jgi:hypothetical protein
VAVCVCVCTQARVRAFHSTRVSIMLVGTQKLYQDGQESAYLELHLKVHLFYAGACLSCRCTQCVLNGTDNSHLYGREQQVA